MFNPGDRLTVLESSTPKGKSGVRRGSTGYVSESHVLCVEKRDDVTFAVVSLHAVFSRFGYEDKERCEEKRIIALYPIARSSYQAQFHAIDNYMGIVKQGNVAKIVSKSMSKHMNSGNEVSAVCFIGRSNALIDFSKKENVNEAICWIESIARNESKWESGILNNFMNTGQSRRPKMDMKHLHTMHEAAFDRSWRKNLTTNIRKDFNKFPVMGIIRDTRLVHLICLRSINNNYIKGLTKHFGNIDQGISVTQLIHNELFSYLIDCCDNPYMYNRIINMVRERAVISDNNFFDVVTGNIKNAHLYMSELAEKIEFEK